VLGVVVRALEAPLVIRHEELRPLDAIVVLGAPLRDDQLTPPLLERVEAAAALWHAGAAPLVIATGGVTRGANRSEAAAIADGLGAHGVTDVIVEGETRTTAENARMTAAILRARAPDPALPGRGPSVWLVTQPFHGRRAARLFRGAGLDPHVWHIVNSLQYQDRRRAMRWIAREYAAWASLFVRGR
jgi:uncharacterized SAM-binding protein YcdF (DUF218 family)